MSILKNTRNCGKINVSVSYECHEPDLQNVLLENKTLVHTQTSITELFTVLQLIVTPTY